MKNIIEQFLDEIDVCYNRRFADRLYNEHPHRNNMFGLKRMLDVYGVKSIGVRSSGKDLMSLNYPCILHVNGDFVIGLDCTPSSITYLHQGKKTTTSNEEFRNLWTGNALVVKETTDAEEPEYKAHRRDEWIEKAKAYSIPVILLVASVTGIATHIGSIGLYAVLGILLSLAGVLVCAMLMQKQLFGTSSYGDRVCSLFHHADCNSILDGPKSKVFGISWSEIGLGYFMANIWLLAIYPEASCAVAVVNWLAMCFGIWSILYQWRVARNWCVLCVLVQILVWAMGLSAFVIFQLSPIALDFNTGMVKCMVFAISILYIHQQAAGYAIQREKEGFVQRYRALKANGKVAKVLFEGEPYYATTFDDSSILFGNPGAKMRVTILSNPHCNPCARMHKRVENLLRLGGDEISVQYIFSSFNEKLEDSSRYLIYCYFGYEQEEALSKFASWYSEDKFNYEKIIRRISTNIHTEKIEEEMERHREWRKRTSLMETPTVLVNGYKLPDEYEIEDLAMIASSVKEENILQDINGRSTTPLGAE